MNRSRAAKSARLRRSELLASPRPQTSGIRVLRTDEELKTAKARALVFETERVQATVDRSNRHQVALDRMRISPQLEPAPKTRRVVARVVVNQLDGAGVR